MSEHYILDGHAAVPVDLMTWARWFETAKRHVAEEMIGDVRISTVFLGLDHRYGLVLQNYDATSAQIDEAIDAAIEREGGANG